MRWPGTIQPSRFLSHTGEVIPGVRRVVQVPNPAAGSDWSITVPAGVQWYVNWGIARLTNSATVANRFVSLTANVDDVYVYQMQTGTALAASASSFINFASGGQFTFYAGAGSFQFFPMPDAPFPSGAIIGSSTSGLQATDQWSGIALWVEEHFFTGAQLSEIARAEAQLERDVAIYEYEQAQQGGGQ